MKGLNIVSLGSALPRKRITNDDLSKIVDTSDEWIVTRTGIKSRYICEEETCSSLAIEAAKRAVANANVFVEDIGIVVVATATPDYAFPSVACLVQRALDMPKETMAFDISAACSGFLYGLKVCKGLLENSDKKYALLIGSEQMSRITDFTDRSTCVLFGDGAGAALLSLDDSEFVHKAWSDGNIDALSCQGVGSENTKICMEGQEVFKFAVRVIREGIDAVLEQAQIKFENIDYVVCHQANERIIDHVSKKFKAPEGKFYKNIKDYANTSAASIPIALDNMQKKNLLKKGMKIILVGFGAGFTWSSALITV